MSFVARAIAVVVVWLAASPALAVFHLWQMNELYSNADGTVQFLEMTALTNGQQFLRDHTLRSTSGGTTRIFEFESDLPGDTPNGRRMLIATQGFAALGLVTPDYIVPNGFFFQAGGTLNFGESSDVWVHPALPAAPLSLNRDGSTATNSPRNFAGQTASLPGGGGGGGGGGGAPPFNVQALWWGGESQSGWGVNVAHQGDILFATWYTYEADGSALWLYSDARRTTGNDYVGQLHQSRGAPIFNYDRSQFGSNPVGTVTFSFATAGSGTFTYTINGVTQSKPISRYVFATPVPTCTQATSANTGPPNYEDLWWGGESQSGWGVNIAHQGNTLFVTWYTYDTDGSPLWLFSDAHLTSTPNTYTGDLYQTRSSSLFSYDTSRFVPTRVGTVTFLFTGSNSATFRYTINGTTQEKAITRYVFALPATTCAFVSAGTSESDPTNPYPKAGAAR